MSQSVIGALRVNLGLDSARFEKGAKQAQKQLRVMQNQFKAAAAGATVVATGLTALTLSTARSAREISGLSKMAGAAPVQFQRWSAAAQSVGVEQDKLADILKDTQDRVGDFVATGGGPMADFFENIAPKVGVTAAEFQKLSGPDALQLYVSSLEKAGVSQQEMTFYMEAMASDATALVPLLQNNGAEMARLGERAEGLGAILDDKTRASLANVDLAFRDVGLAMTGLKNEIVSGVAPTLTALAQSFTASLQQGGALRNVINFIKDNLNELAGIASVGAAVFATRYVGALVLAKAATFSFRGALIALRGALISTGIGALVVGAGILVGKFSELVVATGGFGAAMSLLKDVAVEVSGRIVTYFEGMKMRLKAAWMNIRATAVSSFAGIIEKVLEAVNKVVGAWAGAAKAVAAGWKTMPDVFKRLGAQAVNGLIDILSTGMQGVLAPINALREAVGKDPIKFSALDRFKLDVGDAVDVLGEVKGAFTDAFNADYINTSGIPDAMRGAADDLRANAEGTASYGRALQGLAGRPLTSVQALRDAMSAAKTEAESADAGVDGLNKTMGDLGGGVGQAGKDGGSAGRAAKATKELADEIERLEFEADPVKKYNAEIAHLNKLLDAGLSQGAYDKEVAKLNDELADQLPLMGDISDAWGDFIGRGFRDFKGFANDILDSFKNLITQMIVTAARNRIVIGLGLSTNGVAGAAQAAIGGGGGGGGGGAGGLLGSFGGIGSAFMSGFGNTIGAVFGAGGGIGMGLASIGGQIGAAIAAPTLTSIAGAIGAAAPVIGAVALAATALSKAFSRSYYGSGVRGSLGADGADVQSFDFYKGGAFKSSKTVYKPLEEEMQRMLDDTAIGLADTVRSMADTLGLASDAIDGFAGEAFTIWASGPHAETLEENLQAELDKLAIGMADRVLTSDEFTRAGESSFDTLERLSSSLANVNGAFDLLGLQLKDVGLIGADAASSLVDLFGGLEGFTSSTAAYYQGFYSDAERTAKATELLSASLADLGIDALPRTRAAFRALVDEANSLGDDELTAELIKLAPAFAEIVQGADALTNSLADSPLYRTSADAAYAASADGYRATLEEIRAAEDTNDLLRDVVRAIQEGNINNARLSDKLYQETRRANLGVTS
ncbi:hypothetical protein [Roseovarius nubinhibens]|uniref:Phage-related protein, probable phage tail tape meausure protein, lambda family protein n=1 Tax=Roseovarius nubinhibens (strain ATCC BAA-591 / DSM 15170 / ISM) TaxID=89187 RepID=A3SMQ8_ROSNI|nr:hypothetical protein [Roseovarius nubinhibens]EAP75748.1 phage-related protein, probable phage tail tape meausure protein, lambda family protein [Roseovarius nubinhibens ISM]